MNTYFRTKGPSGLRIYTRRPRRAWSKNGAKRPVNEYILQD
nr:MAG TPA: hypothetical protein [Microviridae sp.]